MACNRCPRRCVNEGFCGFVDPLRGDLYPYMALMMTVSPVERLPLYHFYPGSRVLKIWVGGYTYKCKLCPWSPIAMPPRSLELRRLTVDLIIEKASRSSSGIVAFMGAEPLINDWVYDACRKIREYFPCGFKTSGYIGVERLQEAASNGDFLLFELPGAASLEAPMSHILDNAEAARGMDTHVEYVYLDTGGPRSRAMLGIVAGRLSKDRPLHIYPVAGYLPSPEEAEKTARMLGKTGFNYYYIHRDPSMKYENTYCPRCGYPVIERAEGRLTRMLLKDNRCPRCGHRIEIIGLGRQYGASRVPWLEEEEIVW